MPKFLEEIQLPSLDNVIKPRSGVSIYNDGGAIKILHADGTSQQIMVGDESGDIDFSQYYTKAEVDAIVAGLNSGDIDLSDYYTKEQIDEFLASIADRTDLENYYTKTEIDDKNYATQTYVNDRMTAVDARVDKILKDAPEKFDTLKELADAFDSEEGVFKILEGKQDKLTEADFKTINGTSVFGAGEITITGGTGNVDLTDYYTKEEVDSFDTIISTSVSNLSSRLDNTYDTSSTVDLKVQTAKTELQNKITAISDAVDNKADLADVYTKSEVDSKIDNLNAEDIDLQNYYTKDETDSAIEAGINSLIDGAPTALDTLKEIAATLENDYPKTTYLESQIREIRTDLDKKAANTAVSNLETAITNNNTNITNLTTNVENNYVKKSTLSTDYYNKSTVDSKLSSKVNNSDLDVKVAELNLAISEIPHVSANPTVNDKEMSLDAIEIDGIAYNLYTDDITFSTSSISGANSLRSITVGDTAWNIVGSSSGGTGGGDVDLSDYYTKEQVDTAIEKSITDIIDGAPETYNTFKEISNYIESDLSNTAAMLNTINNKANSGDVYTKSQSDAKYATSGELTTVENKIPDMTQYYTKDETLEVIDKISGLDNYYSKDEVNAEIETINANKQDKLTAGENITIENGVISSTGGGSGSGTSEEMIFSDIADETGTPLRTIKVGSDVWSIPEGGGSGGNVDLSDYYNKTETETFVNDKVAALVNAAPETLDTLGEIATALNSNQELVETLDAAITNKQDKLVSGTNIKTINGQSLVGTGDLHMLSGYNPTIDGGFAVIGSGGEGAAISTYGFNDEYTVGFYNYTKANGWGTQLSHIDLNANGLFVNDKKVATVDDITTPNIVYSETEPENPVLGMIWFSPAQ